MPSTPGSAGTLRSRKRMVRIERAEALLLEEVDGVPLDTPDIVKRLMAEFGVVERTAYEDVAEVFHRHKAANQFDHEARLAEADRAWRRRQRLADKLGDTQAGNFALDRLHKLHGLYAPKKVEHTGAVAIAVAVDVRIDAIVGVLDTEGLAALEVVMAQVERARAAGVLPAVATDASVADPEDEEGAP